MGVHLYTNGAWTDSGKIYRNSKNIFNLSNAEVFDNTQLYDDSGTIKWRKIATTGKTFKYPIGTSTTYTIETFEIEAASIFRWAITNSDISPAEVGDVINCTAGNVSTGADAPFTFSTGINTKYLIVQLTASIIPSALNKFMICLGQSMTENYEPYNVVDWYENNGHGYSSGAWS